MYHEAYNDLVSLDHYVPDTRYLNTPVIHAYMSESSLFIFSDAQIFHNSSLAWCLPSPFLPSNIPCHPLQVFFWYFGFFPSILFSIMTTVCVGYSIWMSREDESQGWGWVLIVCRYMFAVPFTSCQKIICMCVTLCDVNGYQSLFPLFFPSWGNPLSLLSSLIAVGLNNRWISFGYNERVKKS